MARSSNGKYLTVHWIKGDYRGAIDFIPRNWFSKEGKVESLTHEFLSTKNTLGRANCSLSVIGKTAILDYGGKHAEQNCKQLDPGILKVVFTTARRVEPAEILWADDEKARFESGFAASGLDDFDLELAEGSPCLVSHLRRERRPQLKIAKIKQVLAQKGEIRCEACKFSFADRYPTIAGEFCEVHHREELAKSGPTSTTLPKLAILCSNCHRMIHRTRPMLSVEQFAKEIVQFAKGQGS